MTADHTGAVAPPVVANGSTRPVATAQAGVHRPVDLSHAARAKRRLDSVGAKLRARHDLCPWDWKRGQRLFPGRFAQREIGRRLSQQRFDFATEIRLGPCEQSGAIAGFALQRSMIQLLNLVPTVGSRGHVG